jgi:ribulose-phosphate 3-epimerase
MSHIVSPSVLSCDFANIQRDVEMINNSTADWFHVDVMDGVFVPNISFGFPVVEAIKKHATKPLDVHLMIVNPDQYVEQFKKAGADLLTVHYEACTHLHRTIQVIKANGMKAGVALNPHTPINVLEDVIQELDLDLLIMVKYSMLMSE